MGYRLSRGFNLLESMLALALLSVVILSVVLFNSNLTDKKEAKMLSTQTKAFAVTYAQYIKNNLSTISRQAISTPVTLSPTTLGSAWPIDMSQQNMYHQRPCTTIVKNPVTNKLEAIMYYVGGKAETSHRAINVTRLAVSYLGGSGGILLNGSIDNGNSGWQIASGSQFLSGASQCGGGITNNSVAVNLDLLSDWNQDLQPLNALLRGLDGESDIQSLPGHIKNSNTLKSNLYVTIGNGIVLDKNTSPDQVKLAVMYNGLGTGAPTLGLGNSISTKLVSDTFQPNIFFTAGETCNPQEEGKTVADQGIPGATNQFLARNTLVCTQNDLLCGTGNFCYLSSIPNQITFQNVNTGIQDGGGQFICPKSVPFAVNVKTGVSGGGKLYVIANQHGSMSPNSISATLNKGSTFTRDINCLTSGCNPGIRTDYRSGIIDGIGQLMGVDLATVSGSPVGNAAGGGSPGYQIVNGAMGNYTTQIGYKLDTNYAATCPSMCSNLSSVIGSSWQLLGMQRKSRVGSGVNIDNAHLGCACERKDFSGMHPDNYNGIAVIIGGNQPIISSVTCSNMPLFNKI